MPTNIGPTLTDLPTTTGTVLVASDGGLIGSYAAKAYHALG